MALNDRWRKTNAALITSKLCVQRDGWMMLHNSNDNPVLVGDTVALGIASGESGTIEAANLPQKWSKGSVIVKRADGKTREYFPAVAGCRWVKVESTEGVSA